MDNFCKPILDTMVDFDVDIKETRIEEAGFEDDSLSAYKFDIVFPVTRKDSVFNLAVKMCKLNLQLDRMNLI